MFKRRDVLVPGHLAEEKSRILFVLGSVVQHAPCRFVLEASQTRDSWGLFPKMDRNGSCDFSKACNCKAIRGAEPCKSPYP